MLIEISLCRSTPAVCMAFTVFIQAVLTFYKVLSYRYLLSVFICRVFFFLPEVCPYIRVETHWNVLDRTWPTLPRKLAGSGLQCQLFTEHHNQCNRAAKGRRACKWTIA